MTSELEKELELLGFRGTEPPVPSTYIMGLALALAIGFPLMGESATSFAEIQFKRTDDTVWIESHGVSEVDLFNALKSIHDRMLAEAKELDPDARELLYKNLWQLYS